MKTGWSGGERAQTGGADGGGRVVGRTRVVRGAGAVVAGSLSGGEGPFGCDRASRGSGRVRWELGGRVRAEKQKGGERKARTSESVMALTWDPASGWFGVMGEGRRRDLERVLGRKLGRTGLGTSPIFLLVTGALGEESPEGRVK